MRKKKQKQASLFRRLPHAKGLADFSLNALKTLIPDIHDCESAGRIDLYILNFLFYLFLFLVDQSIFISNIRQNSKISTKHYRVHYTLEPPIIS